MVGTQQAQSAESTGDSSGPLASQLEGHAADVAKLETFIEDAQAIFAAIDFGDLLADLFQDKPGVRERHSTLLGLLKLAQRRAADAAEIAEDDLSYSMQSLAREVRAMELLAPG